MLTQETRNKEQKKPRNSRKKKIIKIRVQMDEMKNKNNRDHWNKRGGSLERSV